MSDVIRCGSFSVLSADDLSEMMRSIWCGEYESFLMEDDSIWPLHAQEGIRPAPEDVREGRVRPAKEWFDEFEPGMAHVVNLTARAEQDLAYLCEEINAEHSEGCFEMVPGPQRDHPQPGGASNRCPVTPKDLAGFIPPHAKVFFPASIEREVWEYFSGKAEQRGVELSEL